MTDFGFTKRDGERRPSKEPITGIPKGAITVSPDAEARADRAGEALGFHSRREYPIEPEVRGRRKSAVPSKSLFIKGPEPLIDWFIRYADEGKFRSYWEALAELRKRAGE